MPKEEQYYVQIVETETKKVEREMGPFPKRKAEKVFGGASINLNHDKFHLVLKKATKKKEKRA